MTRSKARDQPGVPPELAVSAEEARLDLKKRIDKGHEIKAMPINSLGELDVAKNSYFMK